MLDIEHINVSYGRVEAVRDVSLAVRQRQIVSVIGPNGAGKTTLLAAIMGLLPWTGTARYDGHDLARMDVEERVAAGLCLVPEKRELFAEMSVADNLRLGGWVHRRTLTRAARQTALDTVYDLFPRLAERRRQLAATLSGGERQMLALGRALMSRPRLLMLDEPSLGLAPLIVREVFQTITTLRQTGVSILLVEQNARAALQISDHATVLETGTVATTGPAAALLDDPGLVATYLGGGRKEGQGAALDPPGA